MNQHSGPHPHQSPAAQQVDDPAGVEPSVELLGTAACWALLRTAAVARLAVCVDGAPDVFPVNVAVDHGSLVFRTAAGRKLDAVLAGEVALEADGLDGLDGTGGLDGDGDGDGGRVAWSVVARGRAQLLHRTEELRGTADLPLAPWHAGGKPHFVRLVPTELSGRRFAVTAAAGWELPHVRAGGAPVE
ncbi:pyridoxamine 5'-phosphate oxidase family protein [Kineococcus glutinatus]|uniref:Pyridoxamine 5'-phosphate oxidase family protein n=1 Tax=Kineococcus glutinatus TaxID=1070872 RepID=A0ABP8VHC9_9ACTN